VAAAEEELRLQAGGGGRESNERGNAVNDLSYEQSPGGAFR